MRGARENGFTLIEVIIALSIFAILSIVGYKGVSSLIHSKERVEAEDLKWQQLELFFDRFSLDVKQSVNRTVITQDGERAFAWLGMPSYVGEYDAQLVFSRLGDPEQNGFLMDTRRIGYRLNAGAIELLIWPSLDLAPSAKPQVFKVLPHVSQLRIKYLSSSGRWSNFWPDANDYKEQKSYAPSAVELAIKLDSGELVTRVFAL